MKDRNIHRPRLALQQLVLRRLIGLLGLVLCCTVAVHAQAIKPYQEKLSIKETAVLDKLLARETPLQIRFVTLDQNAFSKKQVVLQLFQDIEFDLRYFDIGNTGITAESWVGTDPTKRATACFVFEGQTVLGQIGSAEGNFGIFPLGEKSAVHAIVHLDTNYPPCGNDEGRDHHKDETLDTEHDQFYARDDRGVYHNDRMGGGECNIRVVIGYTPTAQASSGLSMTQLVQIGVLNANTAYAASDVNQRMELAYLYETDDDESNNACNDVNDLQDNSDARWNEIHTFRNLYDGDMVGLVTGGLYATNPACNPNNGLCGRAFAFDYTDPANMFQVTEFFCIQFNFTMAHEFGHTQGLRHDNDGNNSPFAHAHGFNTLNDFRTIMALNDTDNPTTRVNVWSNPDIDFPGTTTAAGVAGTNDNARALDDGEAAVINHRTTPNSITLSETIGDDEYVDMVAFDMITAENFTAEDNSMVILRAGDNVILRPEFFSAIGSDSHVFIQSGCDDGSSLVAETDGTTIDVPPSATTLGDMRLEVYPNPTVGLTNLRYELPEGGPVSIQVLNTLGNLMKTVEDQVEKPAGVYRQVVDLSMLPAGMYYIAIVGANDKRIKPVILQRAASNVTKNQD
ncbi:MAG: T9SS type A sorting domain-containing protein [Bacteroidota bacterium]